MAKIRTSRLIQIVLLILIVGAAVRLGMVMRARHHRPAVGPAKPSASKPPLNPEAYVVPRKLHLSDLQSARELTQQPEWVQEGYRYTVYPWDAARHRADFQHPAGMLSPIQEIHIHDVAKLPTPGAPAQGTVLAIFKEDGKDYAVPVGNMVEGSYQIYADEMFFYEDPRQLYSFWPSDVWKAINEHRLEKGMNEYQAAFAVGMGQPRPGGNSEEKVVVYPNGGRPLVATYRNGRVAEIKPGS